MNPDETQVQETSEDSTEKQLTELLKELDDRVSALEAKE